jgi:Cu2+-exporting ATPase
LITYPADDYVFANKSAGKYIFPNSGRSDNMLIEVCLISAGLHAGSKLYKKVKEKFMPDAESKTVMNPETADLFFPDKKEVSDEEKMTNRHLAAASVATVIALGGFIFSPLTLIAGLMSLYFTFPIFRAAKEAIFEERRVRICILDSTGIVIAYCYGYVIIVTITGIAYYTAKKMLLKTENQAKHSLFDIFGQQPRDVWVVKDGTEVQIPFESLQIGDILAINAGEQIPVDGTIVKGVSSIDQHILTGESQPAEKGLGDMVFASTIVISGNIRIRVEKTGEETVAAAIGKIMNNTADFTASLTAQGQRLADRSVLPTIFLSIFSYPFVGATGTVALLTSDFFDNMRIVAPIGMLNFLRTASGTGILVKDGRSLELLTQIDTIVFDKTGTLTTDQPYIEKIHTFNGAEEEQVLLCAAAAEYKQKHPIAMAILEGAKKRGVTPPEIDDANYKIGYGIRVKMKNKTVRAGSDRFMDMEGIEIPEYFEELRETGHSIGRTFVYVAADDEIIGAIELSPTIRPEALKVIERFKQKNIGLYIISGDNEEPTKNMAHMLGIDNYFAKVLPEDKAGIVEYLQKKGKKVCFVGDGINDSIALKKANVSVSMSGASTVATDTAQIVLMDQSLEKLPDIFEISQDFQNNIKDAFYIICAPAVLGIGGVFFAGFTALQVLSLYVVSMVSGSFMTALPILKFKEAEKKRKKLEDTASAQGCEK